MTSYFNILKDIKEKGTEAIKYKLYNSKASNKELLKMYNEYREYIQNIEETEKKRGYICNLIVELLFKYDYSKNGYNENFRKSEIYKDEKLNEEYRKNTNNMLFIEFMYYNDKNTKRKSREESWGTYELF